MKIFILKSSEYARSHDKFKISVSLIELGLFYSLFLLKTNKNLKKKNTEKNKKMEENKILEETKEQEEIKEIKQYERLKVEQIYMYFYFSDLLNFNFKCFLYF